jgi:hypothetical protein
MLRTLCLILDQKSQELHHDFKSFKCNGFYNWYESFSIFPWLVPSYDPSYDDLEANNKKIGVYVSTDKDPFVWANYNGTLHFSDLAESYSKAGIWLITCAIALAMIPLLVYYKEPITNYRKLSNDENEKDNTELNKLNKSNTTSIQLEGIKENSSNENNDNQIKLSK